MTVGAGLWSSLIHRIFPWRAPIAGESAPPQPAKPERMAKPPSGASIRLARRNANTGLARFTGRSVERMFLAAMSRPHRYPGA